MAHTCNCDTRDGMHTHTRVTVTCDGMHTHRCVTDTRDMMHSYTLGHSYMRDAFEPLKGKVSKFRSLVTQ